MTTQLTFDIEAVTTRMLVDFKRETGVEFMSVAEQGIDPSKMEAVVLAGVIWLAMRMSGHPDATFDDALDVPITSLEMGDVPEDPTKASNAA